MYKQNICLLKVSRNGVYNEIECDRAILFYIQFHSILGFYTHISVMCNTEFQLKFTSIRIEETLFAALFSKYVRVFWLN